MPANFTTFAHFLVSSARSLPYSVGESASGVLPRSAIRALILGSARAALMIGHMYHAHAGHSGLMLNDLLSGQLQFAFDAIASSIGHIRAGRLRALGVGNATRVEALPDVPAIAVRDPSRP